MKLAQWSIILGVSSMALATVSPDSLDDKSSLQRRALESSEQDVHMFARSPIPPVIPTAQQPSGSSQSVLGPKLKARLDSLVNAGKKAKQSIVEAEQKMLRMGGSSQPLLTPKQQADVEQLEQNGKGLRQFIDESEKLGVRLGLPPGSVEFPDLNSELRANVEIGEKDKNQVEEMVNKAIQKALKPKQRTGSSSQQPSGSSQSVLGPKLKARLDSLVNAGKKAKQSIVEAEQKMLQMGGSSQPLLTPKQQADVEEMEQNGKKLRQFIDESEKLGVRLRHPPGSVEFPNLDSESKADVEGWEKEKNQVEEMINKAIQKALKPKQRTGSSSQQPSGSSQQPKDKLRDALDRANQRDSKPKQRTGSSSQQPSDSSQQPSSFERQPSGSDQVPKKKGLWSRIRKGAAKVFKRKRSSKQSVPNMTKSEKKAAKAERKAQRKAELMAQKKAAIDELIAQKKAQLAEAIAQMKGR